MVYWVVMFVQLVYLIIWSVPRTSGIVFMYHVVSFTVLLCNLTFYLSLLDFLYHWLLSVSL